MLSCAPLPRQLTMILTFVATFIALSITGAVFYSPVVAGNQFLSLAGFSSQHPYVLALRAHGTQWRPAAASQHTVRAAALGAAHHSPTFQAKHAVGTVASSALLAGIAQVMIAYTGATTAAQVGSLVGFCMLFASVLQLPHTLQEERPLELFLLHSVYHGLQAAAITLVHTRLA